MCLILFALNNHPKYKLIMAANRDEFFKRPTLNADFWEENNSILGGRDIQSGGTWLGATKNGRFIGITNFRDPENEKINAKSRGELSKTFLTQNQNITAFISEVSKLRNQYNGFNLLLSDDSFDTLYHYSNISDETTKIKKGVHGLSNHLLDTPWPKIQFGKDNLSHIIKSESIDMYDLVEMLRNDHEALEKSLPTTGISFDLEKKLSPVFISLKEYGTRCSTIVLVDKKNDLSFLEVSYDEQKQIFSKQTHRLQLKS